MIKIDTQKCFKLFEEVELYNDRPAILYVPQNEMLDIDGLTIKSNTLIGGKFLGRQVKSDDTLFSTGKFVIN